VKVIDKQTLSLRRYVAILVLLAIPLSINSVHAEELEGPPRCATLDHGARFWSPITRIGVTELGMYAGLLVFFPNDFDNSNVTQNRAQVKRTWTSPPRYDPSFEGGVLGSDGDHWAFNVFGHGLFGSEAYLAARAWGHHPLIAISFSIISSAFWEYMVEGWYQQPSTIDLFWTPLGGSFFGELRYQGYMAAKKGIDRKVPRTILMVLLDPIGELECLIMGCQRL
jgi:hypothetical protein